MFFTLNRTELLLDMLSCPWSMFFTPNRGALRLNMLYALRESRAA